MNMPCCAIHAVEGLEHELDEIFGKPEGDDFSKRRTVLYNTIYFLVEEIQTLKKAIPEKEGWPYENKEMLRLAMSQSFEGPDVCPVLEATIESVEENVCPFSGNKCESGSFVVCKHFWTCVNNIISKKKEQ